MRVTSVCVCVGVFDSSVSVSIIYEVLVEMSLACQVPQQVQSVS